MPASSGPASLPIRSSLALLLPALGQSTMVNRFSPPFTGPGTLASAQLSTLLSSTPEIQMEEMVPFGTSHAGSKKQGMPLPHIWGEAPTTAEAPRTTLPTTAERYGDYSQPKISLPQAPTPTRKSNACNDPTGNWVLSSDSQCGHSRSP